MKHQKEKSNCSLQPIIPFSFLVVRIHIKVKFSCRLYLEYFANGQTKKSKQIRIDQKNTMYHINQEINCLKSTTEPRAEKMDSSLAIHIKLLSNKGLAFTAGFIQIGYADFIGYPQSFTLKLMKAQDFDAYLDCRRSATSQNEVLQTEFKGMREFSNQTESKISLQKQVGKIKQDLLQSKVSAYQSAKAYSVSSTSSKSIFNKAKMTVDQYEIKEHHKQLQQRIEYLESQLHKNTVFFEKQKQIIGLLQSKQQEMNEQNKGLKRLLKVYEGDIDEKRQKIRQLQGQKVKLLMNSLQLQKQISSLKQKISRILQRSYLSIRNIFKQRSKKVFQDFDEKQDDKNTDLFKQSLSKITKKEDRGKHNDARSISIKEQEMSKLTFSAVRGLMNKEVGQGWLQDQSMAYRQNTSSVLSNTLYDMSISNINGKVKQVSLMKPKPTQSQLRAASTSKQYIDEISKCMNQLEVMVSKNIQKMLQSCLQAIQKHKHGKHNESGQQSLLSYLQQLEHGFEKQLGVLGQKQKMVNQYEQFIEDLNENLSQKQNLIVQLQQQLFKLEEQRDQIKSELHQNNYAHAIKQQEYLKKIHILQHGINMPDYSSSASPSKTVGRRKEHKVILNPHQQQLIEYKQNLRLMEIQLIHQREERSKLLHLLHNKQLQLQQMQIQQRKMQFSMKFTQRMVSLDQSIELSIQNEESLQPKNYQKLTLQSISYDKGYTQ